MFSNSSILYFSFCFVTQLNAREPVLFIFFRFWNKNFLQFSRSTDGTQRFLSAVFTSHPILIECLDYCREKWTPSCFFEGATKNLFYLILFFFFFRMQWGFYVIHSSNFTIAFYGIEMIFRCRVRRENRIGFIILSLHELNDFQMGCFLSKWILHMHVNWINLIIKMFWDAGVL